MIYLTSYKPLICKPAGLRASSRYNLPPFLDGSCRREPDFQSPRPSISALCRLSKFAPRLRLDDLVVYMTTQANYLSEKEKHWRFVAVLRVTQRFLNHNEAATWYRANNFPLPSNCIVRGNPPLPLSRTIRAYDSITQWDLIYKKRVRKYPLFLACESLFMNLANPPIITREIMMQVFRRIPGTQTPPLITQKQYDNLRRAFGA